MSERISRDTYFMVLAQATSLRSTCPRRSVGCVLTDVDNHIVASGYNGAPKGHQHCLDVGCLMHNGVCLRTVHAELNAFLQCKTVPTSMYTTDQPCIVCYKAAINSGVQRIVYLRPYPDEARDKLIDDTFATGIDMPEMSRIDDYLEMSANDVITAMKGKR